MRQQYIHVFIEGQKEEQAKPASRVSATAPQNIAKNTAAGRWTNPGPERLKIKRTERRERGKMLPWGATFP